MSNGVKVVEQFEYYHFVGGGGTTTCNLFDEKYNLLAIDIAICSPKDAYSKKRGWLIARGRAAKALITGKDIITRSGKERYKSYPMREKGG